jgi:hypothetical protein
MQDYIDVSHITSRCAPIHETHLAGACILAKKAIVEKAVAAIVDIVAFDKTDHSSFSLLNDLVAVHLCVRIARIRLELIASLSVVDSIFDPHGNGRFVIPGKKPTGRDIPNGSTYETP